MTGPARWRGAGGGSVVGVAAGAALLVVAALALAPRTASAQLISPGKLARQHGQLEGLEH